MAAIDRDRRYNASKKGRARSRRAESSEYRAGYRAGYQTGRRKGLAESGAKRKAKRKGV